MTVGDSDALEVSDQAVRAEIAGQLAYSGDAGTGDRLVAVLAHLPEGVRAFALGHCAFTAAGQEAPRRASDRVRVSVPAGSTESAIRRAVAHAWLGHRTAEAARTDPVEDEAVADLVAQWEFTGPGADA